jgi:hypothetical protein
MTIGDVLLSLLPEILKNLRDAIPRSLSKWRLRKFFGSSAVGGTDIHIVLDPYQHPLPRTGNRYIKRFFGRRNDQPLIGEDNVLGINAIRVVNYAVSLFSLYRKHDDPLRISLDEDVRDLWDGTFLCFGSSDSNIKSLDIENLHENNFYSFQFDAQGQRCFNVRGEQFSIHNQEDVGIILKLRNPYHPEHSLFICAGLGEWGTSGSAYFCFIIGKQSIDKPEDVIFARL